ncbi:histidine--tRNA ligase [Patescibacteria group bacterium]|nr:histidine--tRNA ligase [Patescibacteria group bacterium]
MSKPTREKKTVEQKPKPVKKTARLPQLVRGMKDILPNSEPYWEFVYNKVAGLAKDFNYGRIEVPILEETNLFVRSVGRDTDIIEKEMYTFEDRGGDTVSMRPEATAGVVRAYINHGMLNLPQPVKLWYWGPMFRYDRPQSGRYRQFFQFGFEALGDEGAIVDAQLIIIAHDFFKEIGLPVTIQINSLGTPESCQVFKVELVAYYRSRRGQLCDDCKKRLNKNPLRLLDCKEAQCREIRNEAPQIVDWLDEDSKNHFMKVLEYLDEVEVPYVLNPFLVRGLDYYTRTVFEIWPEGDDEEARQNSLGGGGRYDLLTELLGGRPTPAGGFAVGIERIVNAMKAKEVTLPPVKKPKIFLAQLGEAARTRALSIFEEFRAADIPVAEAFSKDSLKAQLEIADSLGVKFTLVLGQKEVLDGTVLIRDMEAGIQEIVDQRKIIKEVKKKLDQGEVGFNNK